MINPINTTRAALSLACALAVIALAALPALAQGRHHPGAGPDPRHQVRPEAGHDPRQDVRPGAGHHPRHQFRPEAGPHPRHHARRPLPPEIAYRDPRGLGPPPRIIRGYLPRNHAVPMYNEPPQRFPQL
jgi:hypothetical protein